MEKNREETYLRSRAYADFIGVKEQTLRAWRVNRSDGPIFVRDGRVIPYPVRASTY